MTSKREKLFKKRQMRVRYRLRQCADERVRLSVHRSNRNISAQLIDDRGGHTVASASSLEPVLEIKRGNTRDAAKTVGQWIAKRAVEAGIRECYLDRGGYRYHGRIKALAEAARAGGLNF